MKATTENNDASKPLLRRGLVRLPYWLKNKYLIAGVAFLVVLFFFDDNNLFLQVQRWKKVKELNKTEKQLSAQISETHKELNLLKTNAETVEKYAREKYLMKKDNEDLFVVQAPSK